MKKQRAMQPEPPEIAPEAEEASAEPTPQLADQLREAEAKAAEHHDAWLRAKAEAENIRKRAQEDIAKAHKFGIERFAADLLPVKDSLEAALAAESGSVENLKSGVELRLRQVEGVSEQQWLP